MGYDQRIIGQPSSSFQGLLSVKSQTFDADKQERLTRSSKILPGVAVSFALKAVVLQKNLPQAGLLATSKNFPGVCSGGGMFALGIY